MTDDRDQSFDANRQLAEAVDLGRALDDHHMVRPSPTGSDVCEVCSFRAYEPAKELWWHLPSIDDRKSVRSWLASRSIDDPHESGTDDA